jgi:HEAT repeat protein
MGKKAVFPMTGLLDKSRPVFTQVQIIRALGKLKANSAVHYLQSCLMDEFWENRIASAEALGEIGDESSIKPLLKVLEDLDETLRAQAVFALGKIGNKKVVYDISKCLNDEFSVQINSIRALGMIRHSSALQYLYPFLKSSSVEILKEVVTAIFMIGESDSLKKMTELFEKAVNTCLISTRDLPWEEFCIFMIEQFGDKHFTGVFDSVRKLSSSPHNPVRHAVVSYCGKIRTAGSEKLLVGFLADHSFRVRYLAFQELATISQYKKAQAPKEKNKLEEAKKEFNLGLMFFKKDRLDEAIVCFNKTIKYLPTFSLGYFNLAIVYQKKGFIDKAGESFRLSIVHDKKFLKGYFYYGAILAMKKEFKKAREVFESALKNGNPKSKFYNYIKNYTKTLDKMEIEQVLEKNK